MASRWYTLEISRSPGLVAFIKADIRNGSLDNKEMHLSWKEEMEPTLSTAIAPSLELSRAYRYLCHARWRIAIICMNQLEKKYAHWEARHKAETCADLGLHRKGHGRGAAASAKN